MKIQITICSLLLVGCLFGQTKDTTSKVSDWKFGMAFTVGFHNNIYNKGLNQLNGLLSQNNIPPFATDLNSVGTGFVIRNRDFRSFFDISFITNTILGRPLTDQDWLVPKFKGVIFCGGGTKKIWEKKKFRVDGGFALSSSRYSFRLINRRSIASPFDTLLKHPSQSFASLDCTQKSSNLNIEGRLGITYDAKWFPKTCDSYEFSLYINYSQAIFQSKSLYLTDTKVPVNGLPNINFSSVYFQFVNTVYFKLKN